MLTRIKRLFFPTSPTQAEDLRFKDNLSAFEFACAFLQDELEAGAVIPALVQDAKLVLGAERAITIMPDGTQMVALTVCSKDGGFLVLASALSQYGPKLRVGDLVAWRAGGPVSHESHELRRDSRSRWTGIVLASLKAEYKTGRGWAIAEPFRSNP